MPYKRIEELPDNIKESLPKKAQKIWMSSFNNVLKSCVSGGKSESKCEDVARIAAWVAVKAQYRKNKDGNWVLKEKD